MIFKFLLSLALLFLVTGCAAPDGDDLEAFVRLVETLPVEERTSLKAKTKEAKTLKDLRKHPLNSQVVVGECRYKTDTVTKYRTGKWTDWAPFAAKPVLLRDIVICFVTGRSYADCISAAVQATETILAPYLDPNGPIADLHKGFIWECRARVEGQFSPDVVEGANEDVNRIKWIEVFEFLMESPVPPSGIPVHVWEVLAPVLVANTTWGRDAAQGAIDTTPPPAGDGV
jgi:hypothetical protein